MSLYRNNVGTTQYQGFELSLRQRLARGLSYSVAYTRSKLLDDASSVFDASILTGPIANYPVADSFNRALERDYSTGDMPHVFVSSVVWDLPAGAGRGHELPGVLGAMANDWTLAALVTLQSGMPVAVTQTTNNNAAFGFGVQRPNLVGDPTLPAEQRTTSQWFNTAAFTAAPVFTLGSASRNPVRGPSYRDVDLALMRRVPIRAGASLELRAEVFNLLNTRELRRPKRRAGFAGLRDDHDGPRSARRAAGPEVDLLVRWIGPRSPSSLRLATATTLILLARRAAACRLARALASARADGRSTRSWRCRSCCRRPCSASTCSWRWDHAARSATAYEAITGGPIVFSFPGTAGRVGAIQPAVRRSAVRRGICGCGSQI